MAVFVLDSIDRMPLGDMTATIHTLVTCHEEMDLYYRYARDGRAFHAGYPGDEGNT